MEVLSFFLQLYEIFFHVEIFFLGKYGTFFKLSRSLSFFYHRTCNNIFWGVFLSGLLVNLEEAFLLFYRHPLDFVVNILEKQKKKELSVVTLFHSCLAMNERFSKQYKGKFH